MYAWGESPWICQKDMSVVLSFAVGTKLCRVNLAIAKGVIVQELCQRLFNEEDIPIYLQSNLMDGVLRAVNDAYLSPVKHSEDILDVGSMIESARLLSRQFDVTTTISQVLANSFVTSNGLVDITWSLKPNPGFAAELGRHSSPPPRNSNSGSSSAYSGSGRPSSPSLDNMDAKKMFASSVSRGARTPYQSLQLAKMYHFLVAGDHSVTFSGASGESKESVYTSSSLIDGGLELIGGGLRGSVMAPEIVKLEGVDGGVGRSHAVGERKRYFRTKRQVGGAELLLLQDTTNEFREMIAELEKSLAQSMSQLIHAKDIAMTSLSEKHAKEMDRISVSGQLDRIPAIVERQLSEMEGLEAKWQVELAEAEKRQRREYLSFCSDLYKNRERYLEDKRAMGPQQISLLRQRHTQSHLLDSSNSTKRFLSGGWTSLIFGKAANTANEHDKVIRVASHNSSLLMARETTHGDHGTYSIVVMLGSQLKVPFEVQVYGSGGMLSIGNIGNVAALTPTSPHAASSSHLSHTTDISTDSIYSSSLTAMILMTDPQMNCNSPTYNDFFAIASHSTELHFQSARDQIDHARTQILSPSDPTGPNATTNATTNNAARLQPGDFFVTTHSNLGKMQVVFHMAGERQNMANSWPQMLAGLKNILTVASHYDITTLSIPILLVEPEFRHLYSDGQGLKRAEEVVRTIRSFLVLNSASGISLKTIRLVCPPQHTAPSSTSHGLHQSAEDPLKQGDMQLFEKIKSVVSTLFNQPLH